MSRFKSSVSHKVVRIMLTALALICVTSLCMTTVSARIAKPTSKPIPRNKVKETTQEITTEATETTTTITAQILNESTSETTATQATEPTTVSASETTTAQATELTTTSASETTAAQATEPTTTVSASETTIAQTTEPTTTSASETTTAQTTKPTTTSTSETTAAQTTKPTTTSASETTTTQTSGQTTASSTTSTETQTTNATTVSTTTTESTGEEPEPTVAQPVTTYYVASEGNDNNSGSDSAPFKTIQFAINNAPSGSTIVVAAGTYQEKLRVKGKVGLKITNRPGETPVLSGASFTSGNLIEITGSSDVIFQGFDVRDFRGNAIEVILIQDGSSNIEISNNKFHDLGTTKSTGNAHIILALGNSNNGLKNIKIKNNQIYNCATGWSESITMESNVNGFTISGNIIHDVTNIAIDATGFYDNGVTDASQNQARNGIITNNLVYNAYSPNASCAGIYVDGGRDIVIEYNTVYNVTYGIEVGCELPYDESSPSVRAVVTNVKIRNNVIFNNTDVGILIGGYDGSNTGMVANTQVYNNTLYRNGTEIELSTCDTITISKNILCTTADNNFLYNDTSSKATNLKMDNNIFYSESGSGSFDYIGKYASSLAQWQKISGMDLNSKFVDPSFVSPQTMNFKLISGSPATGYGADLN